MEAAHPVHRLTEAEYLEAEHHAEFRSEFLDGEMFAMAGGANSDSLISGMPAVGVTSSLAAVYSKVEFAEAPRRPELPGGRS
jgi:hypothetical protein